MNELVRALGQEQLKKEVPNFGPGDTVRVHVKIKEGNRERIQTFEGFVLKRQNGGIAETFRGSPDHETGRLPAPHQP